MQKLRFKFTLDRWVVSEDAKLKTKRTFVDNMLGRWCDEEMLY